MNIKKRRESVASVYKRTTKFLTTNTTNLLRKRSNSKKYSPAATNSDEINKNNENNKKIHFIDDEDFGERDLDYYMGVRKRETYWRDPSAIEKIRKDYLVYHCGVTEEEYETNYKKSYPETTIIENKPKLKQVPFKIHRKKKGDNKDESWKDKSGIFKLFTHRKDSEYSTSDSYSECDSEDIVSLERKSSIANVIDSYNTFNMTGNPYSRANKGVRIKEVSDGRPCDNCPELCPGFIPHAWSNVPDDKHSTTKKQR